MRLDVLTLFPEIFQGYLGQSLLKRAIDAGLVEVVLHNIRDWAQGKHKQVDDRPFGGGPGMVMMVEPVVECVEAVRGDCPDFRAAAGRHREEMAGGAPKIGLSPSGNEQLDPGHLVMLSPQGRRLDQAAVERLAREQRIILLCGRYEGFDERIRLLLEPEEISIGDYVLNGGEVAAMVIIDAVMRLVPNVLGDADSSGNDSFSMAGRLLEFAQYTRPRAYRGLEVPEVLLSGDHQEVERWRQQNSRQRTSERRADLFGLHDSQDKGTL
jgi:tRNA (guanine37-N1)-methyltransferase